MESGVKMSVVLSEINRYEEDGKLREFELTYVTTSGKLCVRKRMSKGGNAHKPAKSSGDSTRTFYKVKEKGILMLYNEEKQRYETPKISLITHYDGQRVWH